MAQLASFLAAVCFATVSQSLVCADMLDVLLPHYLPPAECTHGCLAWSDLPPGLGAHGELWAAGRPPPNASNHCAIPAAAVDEPDAGAHPPSMCGGKMMGDLVCNSTMSSFYGPICACAPTSVGDGGSTVPIALPHVRFATCTAPASYPEQVNLQIAASDTLVVSFVTFEATRPTTPPTVQLRRAGATGWPQGDTGVAHRYTTSHAPNSPFCSESLPSSIHCLRRNYTMSFVRLTGLVSRHKYEYR